MVRVEIIEKDSFNWWIIYTYPFWILVNLLFAFFLIMISVIPLLNYYFLTKRLRDDFEADEQPNPLFTTHKYRVVEKKEIVKQVLERID
jgi:hypothetical protein